MRISILDKVPEVVPRIANVATENAENGGYLYETLGRSDARLYLGFSGKLQQNNITYINPYWGTNVGTTELLPASRNDINIVLSADAKRFGARASLQFSGASPRIAVTFESAPTSGMTVGLSTVGFAGLWPLKGSYICYGLQDQISPLRKALEPYGSIVLRQTWLRILNRLVADLIQRAIWRIDAIDEISQQFILDNLLADLSDLLAEDVGKRSVTLKASSILPNTLMNAYENSQDGIFARTVSLTI
jgi:hypothetical protein